MRNKIFNYFEIAGKIALSKEDQRSFIIGSIGIRKDQRMVQALNSASQYKDRFAHSEKRLSSKLDVGSVVYVCRVRLLDGTFAMARPCFPCMKSLISVGVDKVYYTISQQEFGMIKLKNMDERIYNM